VVLEHEAPHPSRWATIRAIAAEIGCTAHRLKEWGEKQSVTPVAALAQAG
jgi:transposase